MQPGLGGRRASSRSEIAQLPEEYRARPRSARRGRSAGPGSSPTAATRTTCTSPQQEIDKSWTPPADVAAQGGARRRRAASRCARRRGRRRRGPGRRGARRAGRPPPRRRRRSPKPGESGQFLAAKADAARQEERLRRVPGGQPPRPQPARWPPPRPGPPVSTPPPPRPPALGSRAAYPGDDAPKEQLAAWLGQEAEKRGLQHRSCPVDGVLVESGVKNLNSGDAVVRRASSRCASGSGTRASTRWIPARSRAAVPSGSSTTPRPARSTTSRSSAPTEPVRRLDRRRRAAARALRRDGHISFLESKGPGRQVHRARGNHRRGHAVPRRRAGQRQVHPPRRRRTARAPPPTPRRRAAAAPRPVGVRARRQGRQADAADGGAAAGTGTSPSTRPASPTQGGQIDPRVIAAMAKLVRGPQDHGHLHVLGPLARDRGRLDLEPLARPRARHRDDRRRDRAPELGGGARAGLRAARSCRRSTGRTRSVSRSSPSRAPAILTDAAHQDHIHFGFKQEITKDWRPPADVAAGGSAGAPAAAAAAVPGAAAPRRRPARRWRRPPRRRRRPKPGDSGSVPRREGGPGRQEGGLGRVHGRAARRARRARWRRPGRCPPRSTPPPRRCRGRGAAPSVRRR